MNYKNITAIIALVTLVGAGIYLVALGGFSDKYDIQSTGGMLMFMGVLTSAGGVGLFLYLKKNDNKRGPQPKNHQ